jgi:hypothetical protein
MLAPWSVAPDVNPSTTTVEVGGTAYRYYLALNSANQPQGGVAVSAQVSGGNPIPQSGEAQLPFHELHRGGCWLAATL